MLENQKGGSFAHLIRTWQVFSVCSHCRRADGLGPQGKQHKLDSTHTAPLLSFPVVVGALWDCCADGGQGRCKCLKCFEDSTKILEDSTKVPEVC